MREQYEAVMVSLYFGENDKWDGQPLYGAIVGKCEELGIASAMVFRGIEGFGGSAVIHRSKIWTFSKDVPISIDIVDVEGSINKLLPFLEGMIGEGLITRSQVQVLRYF